MGGLPLYLQPAWRASEPHIAPVATWALCVELLFWWHEAGARFYGKGQPTPARDDGLRGLVADAVTVLSAPAKPCRRSRCGDVRTCPSGPFS